MILTDGKEPHFYAKVAPIDVVPQEQVAGVSRIPPDFEELHEIVLKRIR